MATKDQVIAINRKHPTLRTHEIAARLGCKTEFVRATAYRYGVPVPGINPPSKPWPHKAAGKAVRT